MFEFIRNTFSPVSSESKKVAKEVAEIPVDQKASPEITKTIEYTPESLLAEISTAYMQCSSENSAWKFYQKGPAWLIKLVESLEKEFYSYDIINAVAEVAKASKASVPEDIANNNVVAILRTRLDRKEIQKFDEGEKYSDRKSHLGVDSVKT